MNLSPELIILVTVCLSALLIGIMKGKAEWLLNLLMRSILGTIAIYFINQGFMFLGIVSGVGVNPITVLTSGILGFPGLLALYGIKLYKIL